MPHLRIIAAVGARTAPARCRIQVGKATHKSKASNTQNVMETTPIQMAPTHITGMPTDCPTVLSSPRPAR